MTRAVLLYDKLGRFPRHRLILPGSVTIDAILAMLAGIAVLLTAWM